VKTHYHSPVVALDSPQSHGVFACGEKVFLDAAKVPKDPQCTFDFGVFVGLVIPIPAELDLVIT